MQRCWSPAPCPKIRLTQRNRNPSTQHQPGDTRSTTDSKQWQGVELVRIVRYATMGPKMWLSPAGFCATAHRPRSVSPRHSTRSTNTKWHASTVSCTHIKSKQPHWLLFSPAVSAAQHTGPTAPDTAPKASPPHSPHPHRCSYCSCAKRSATPHSHLCCYCCCSAV